MNKFYQKKSFLNGFIDLVKKCNIKILDIYKSNYSVEYKDDKSPLTNADLESNKLICEYIQLLNKNIKKEINEDLCIISEENKNMNYEKRKDYNYTWLIDPIDGTKEFLKKNGQFTVNIGLCKNGIPIFGIVSIPVYDDIYYGIEGIGSYKIDKNDNKIKLEIKQNKDLGKDNIKIIASSSHMNEETLNYIKKFKNPNLLNIGSSIKLLYIAENKADLYPRFALTSEWDTCAAHAIIKYSNGNVINIEDKKELKYNKENLLNPYFLVY